MSSGSVSAIDDNDAEHYVGNHEERVRDLFNLTQKFGLGKYAELDIHAKYSLGRLNYFAFTLKQTGDLLLVTGYGSNLEVEESITAASAPESSWTFRRIPWFDDPSRRISALSFDEEGLLYVGTDNGTVYELTANIAFSASAEPEAELDLRQTFHLDECKIVDILVWFRDETKIVMCNGGGGKFIFIYSHSLPVLVTFTYPITTMHLFINNAGLSSILICLQNNQNVTTVLDDLDVPSQEESIVKKSIFRRAKENIISRFGDSDKGIIFGRRTSRDGGSGQEVAVTSAESLTTILPPRLSSASAVLLAKSSSVNVKFTTLEELSSRGAMMKICGRNQFYRHIGTKLDLFDADFRQIASMNLPESISKLFVIGKIFYGIDSQNNCVRLSIIHNQMLKEFAIIPLTSKILAVESAGEMGTIEQFSVFLVSTSGIFLLALKKPPLVTCAELLIGESGSSSFDVICTALNAVKNEVYILAGDKSAEEGKFAKTILYYKVAGMTYSKIVAKFGSRRMIPAMLCFYDLVDNEKTRFTGSLTERNIMADLIIQGRVEQYLRHGTKADPAKDPRTLLLQFIHRNEYYSSEITSTALSYPQLLWAARDLSECRLCFTEILQGLYSNQSHFSNVKDYKPPFWNLLVWDWKAIYGASPQVFCWFREFIMEKIRNLEFEVICRLCKSLMPWRRELLRKFFCDVSDVTESIDFTESQGNKKTTNEDYVNLFIHVLLETMSRDQANHCSCRFATLFYNWEANKVKRKHVQNTDANSLVSTLFSSTPDGLKTFSASATHCACIRNGRLYSWGDNRLGRLGIKVNREKFSGPIEIPIPVSISPTLKLVIASVSCGQTHTVALTTAGTVLAFGSNKYGQLGVGRQCVLAETAVFPFVPNVTFICVAAGGYHTVAIDHLNRPWTWGWGIFGQLGNNQIENTFLPTRILVQEKVVMASAGHSHTGLLTINGKVLTFGCSHFGQLGQGLPNVKVKRPTLVDLPAGVIVRSIDCGLCSTVCVTMRNRIFYAGINPSCIRTMLSGARKKVADGRNSAVPQVAVELEEKDFFSPTLIDTSHLAGDIVKVNAATTHFAVLTNTGIVYSWGLGKNGQLMRADDDCKGLGVIDTEDRVLVASDVICAGECSWVIERDSGRIFGYGFNSCGQLGRMDTDQDASILTIKTKKRVLRVRQPANVHYKPKEVTGLPRKSLVAETENAILPQVQISPPTDTVGNELLIWVLKTFHRNYTSKCVASLVSGKQTYKGYTYKLIKCAQYENHEGAATVYMMERDYEGVLHHRLQQKQGSGGAEVLIEDYAKTKDRETNCLQETYRFIDIVVHYWMKRNLLGIELEGILMPYYKRSPWNSFISRALREMISETNDRSKWIAGNFSPSFILACIRDSKVALLEDESFLGKNIIDTSGGGSGKIIKGSGKYNYETPSAHQNGVSLKCD